MQSTCRQGLNCCRDLVVERNGGLAMFSGLQAFEALRNFQGVSQGQENVGAGRHI